jgi:hypothetical protein
MRFGWARRIMILVMTVQHPEKTPSRKQRLQEKQRRQLAVVELALAVAEAVQMFGTEQSASEGLDMPVETIRRFLGIAKAAAAADQADTEAVAAS